MKKLVAILFVCLACALCFPACTSTLRSYGVDDYRTTMQFHDDFKILQLTDLHLGIEGDLEKQLGVVRHAIRTEKPDLVILTGDNFMYATKSVVYQLVKTLNDECAILTQANESLSKFAITFGNHDNQGDYHRYYVNSVIKTFTTTDGKEIEDGKYGAFKDYEDDDLFGLANYYIDLVDDREKGKDEVDVKYRLHIIDSNSYHYIGTEYDYDIIHDEQLEHVKKIYETATADKDYIGMSFFHIPLVEYEEAKNQYESAQNPSEIGQGEFKEGIFSGYKNNGAYEKMRKANIISYFVGHDHKNACDVIYNAHSDKIEDKAIFSFGVKGTNQLYHDRDMIGYKTINLKDGMDKQTFLSIQNISANFINNRAGIELYE